MLRPGIEPEPIAWKAIILPLDQRSLDEIIGGFIAINILNKINKKDLFKMIIVLENIAHLH